MGTWTLGDLQLQIEEQHLVDQTMRYAAQGSEGRVLVTVAYPPRDPVAALRTLNTTWSGATPFIAFGAPTDADGKSYLESGLWLLVERHPEGVPLSEVGPLSSAQAASLGLSLARIVAAGRAQEADWMEGLRPEVVYLRSAAQPDLVAVAPRWRQLRRLSGSEFAVLYFTAPALAPESMRGLSPDPRSDVYQVCSTMAYALLGASPFSESDPFKMFERQLSGDWTSLPAEQALVTIIEGGLAPHQGDRMSPGELVRLLEGL